MKIPMYLQILLGIVFGLFCGVLLREQTIIFEPIGKIFLQLLHMIIVPIVFASLVAGVLNLGSVQRLGRLGFKTFFYYLTTTLLSVALGLFMVNMIKPGVNARMDLDYFSTPESLENSAFGFIDVITRIVPDNIIASMANADMLGVIFFSIIFGCAILSLGKKGEPLANVVHSLNDTILKITDWIMVLAPFGVFALMAVLVGQTGISAFRPLALYMLTVLSGLAIHLFVTLSLILMIVAKVSPIQFMKQMFPAIATAFTTDSSVATLPVTLECLEKEAGISKKIGGFVAPLGATVNMDGTALYEAVAAMFIAQLYGIEMSLLQQLFIMLTATLASIGAAGIPSAGLVTLVIVLRAVGLPLEGIGILLAVDRVLDMCRTSVNVAGDACGAAVLARLDRSKV